MASEGTGPAPAGGRDLVSATATGLVLAVVAFGSLAWHRLAFTAVIVVLLTIAVVETGRVFHGLGRGLHVDVLVVVGVVWLVATALIGAPAQRAGYVVLFAAAVGRSMVARERRDVVATVGATVLLGLWTAGLGTHAVRLVALDGGTRLMVVVLAAVALSDVGAYAVGSAVGRHRLAPSLSPHKTWEGLAGGLLAAGVVGAGGLVWLLGRPWWMGAALGVAVALAGAVGDLAESMLKRDLGVKDLGSTLAGHGGVLDRVDAILFALPVGHLAGVLLLT
jgi:phosphatidate cytidylyltransferase